MEITHRRHRARWSGMNCPRRHLGGSCQVRLLDFRSYLLGSSPGPPIRHFIENDVAHRDGSVGLPWGLPTDVRGIRTSRPTSLLVICWAVSVVDTHVGPPGPSPLR